MAMQISHEYRCIFVHIPKTGGSSVESLPVFTRGNEAIGGHSSALDFRAAFPEEFETYFKFAFVRNPWDRILSGYQYLVRGGGNEGDRRDRDRMLERFPTFEAFCVGLAASDDALGMIHFRPQHRFLCDESGRCLVDFVGRFERLQEDFSEVAKRIGFTGRLPHKRKSPGKYRHYSAAYSAAAVQAIRELERPIIERFGYAFEARPLAIDPRRLPIVEGATGQYLRLKKVTTRALATALGRGTKE